MKPIFVQLGNHLKRARLKSGLSQMTVAKELGYTSSQFVSNAERHICSLPLNKLSKLVKLYGINREELTQIILKAKEKEVRKALGSNKRTR